MARISGKEVVRIFGTRRSQVRVRGGASIGEARISEQPDRPQFRTVDEEGNVPHTLVLSDDDWIKRS